MNYWIIVHRFQSYIEHNDLVGLPVKKDRSTGDPIKDSSGSFIPRYSATNDIQMGDLFAYYCPAPKMYVLGLFKIREGPGIYAEDWNESLHFKIEPIIPIEEEKYVPYSDLVENLNYFKDSDGNVLNPRSASLKLKGTIKDIDETDFKLIKDLYLSTELELPVVESSSLHINMIKTTHFQSGTFHCFSFVGVQERNRVNGALSEDEETEINHMEGLPSWILDIGKQLGTFNRLKYIDNIWFFEESPGFFIPFAAFEHEKDNDLRGVMDRFNALDKTLNSNVHLREIKPIYFLIAKDSQQAESYERKIYDHGEWRQFSNTHKFHIYSIEQLENREPGFIQLITENLLALYKH